MDELGNPASVYGTVDNGVSRSQKDESNKKNKLNKTIIIMGRYYSWDWRKTRNLQQMVLVDMAVSGNLNRDEIKKIELPVRSGSLYKE